MKNSKLIIQVRISGPAEPRSEASPATKILPRDSRPRMVFVSPLPGRWVRWCGLTLSCLALWVARPACGYEAAFDAANQAAAQGKWEEAVRGYENVIASQGYSAPVLFNLANAQAAQKNLGPAVLNYERARWLAPSDTDIAANLALARHQAGVDPVTPSHLATLTSTFTLPQWGILATAMLWLVPASLAFRRMSPRAAPALQAGAVLGCLVLTLSLSALVLRRSDLDRAIVTASEAKAQVSPVNGIPPIFTLRAGEAVTIKRGHGAFWLVVDRQGREGWVNNDAVTPVVCDRPHRTRSGE